MVTVLETVSRYADALDAVRAEGATVGLVPTMGALHAGHLSLIERAARECDVCAVTIFVNPTQFEDRSDLDRYPRNLEADLAAVSAAGGSLVFAPSVDEMYPERSEGSAAPRAPEPVVRAPAVAKRWEGAARPGHFDGVATIVVKLLAGAGPCRAYFGEKDFQQLALIRQLVADHSLPTEVIGCATVRDVDGLALSSRNLRLSAEERKSASVLFRGVVRRGHGNRGGRRSARSRRRVDGADGGSRSRCEAGLCRGRPRRRSRTGGQLCHYPPAPAAHRSRGRLGPADRQSRPPGAGPRSSGMTEQVRPG